MAAWAALIFTLSAQPSLSTNLGVWDFILRKTAHVTEYAVLCLLLWWALRQHIRADRTAALLAAAVALLYAMSDEYHQTFVPGRAGQVRDLGFDLAGILIVALVVAFRSGARR